MQRKPWSYPEFLSHKLGTLFWEDLTHNPDSRSGGYRDRITPGPHPPDRSYTSSAGTDVGSPSPSYIYVSEAHPALALCSSVSSAAAVRPSVGLFCPSAATSVQETGISPDCSQGLGLSFLCLFPI